MGKTSTLQEMNAQYKILFSEIYACFGVMNDTIAAELVKISQLCENEMSN